MSDPAEAVVGRGGPQKIPRPDTWRAGPGAVWSRAGIDRPTRISVADVRSALQRRGDPDDDAETQVPTVALPGRASRPAGVLCALFDQDGQAHVVLTRRSSGLRSHTHQVSFPGGRLESGESALTAALREAEEEVGLDPATVEVIGRLTQLRTALNPAPIMPYVGVLASQPTLRPNPDEVERAFTIPLVELTEADVYRQELWTFPDGVERPLEFFELVGDTVWGATARMLTELLDLVLA